MVLRPLEGAGIYYGRLTKAGTLYSYGEVAVHGGVRISGDEVALGLPMLFR